MKLKKILIGMSLVCIGGIVSTNFLKSSEAAEIRKINLSNYISDTKVNLSKGKITIIGNNAEITSNDFVNLVDNGKNGIYMNYRTNNNIQIPYDMLIAIKVNEKTYSYNYTLKNSNVNLLNTMTNYLKNNNQTIIDKYLNYLFDDSISMYSDVENSPFIDCDANASYVLDFAPHGYITSRLAVKEYSGATDISSLYLLTVASTYVPGKVAYENGHTEYNKWKNNRGYVHIKLEQAFDKNEEYYYGTKYGSMPYLKDYWPKNSSSEVTISSSYMRNYEIGTSKDGKKFNFGGKFNFSHGGSYAETETNPWLNAQLAKDLQTVEWNYTYHENANKSYDLNASCIYEIGKTGNDLLRGDVRAKIDYSFTVDRSGFYTERNDDDSFDLVLRPNKAAGLKIYNFCNGMI